MSYILKQGKKNLPLIFGLDRPGLVCEFEDRSAAKAIALEIRGRGLCYLYCHHIVAHSSYTLLLQPRNRYTSY